MIKNLLSGNIVTKIILIVIVAIIAFIIFRQIKKLINKPKIVNLPSGGTGVPVSHYDKDGKPVFWNPDGLSKKLFEAMEGFTDSPSTKEEAWNEFVKLPTDDMKVSVYNHFNSKHGKGDSLRTWIDDEYVPILPKQRIIEELDRLKLA